MTKKRKRYPDLNQKLERPWCYYCERDFDDLKILISHQKAKHFKCDRCGRRLNTAGGLSVHMNQVHKENLTHVENAIQGRQGLDIEIFGMEGVPAEVVDQHNQQVTQQHFAEEAERARVTGNPVRGLYTNGQSLPNKRTKVKESLDELEKNVGQFRIDRANGVIPKAPEVQPATQTPPAVQPYGPPAGAPVTFPPQAPFGIPPRPGSIPGQPPGALPPRPAFAAPPGAFPPGSNGLPADTSSISASLDDLIGEVRKEAVPEADKKEEKKSKKDKNVKLVYNHDSLSPEERMATLPRFAEFARA